MQSEAVRFLLFGLGVLLVLSFVVRFSLRVSPDDATGKPSDIAASEESMSGWQVICCLLAVPIVYFFEQQIYEALAFIVYGSLRAAPGFFDGIMQGFFRALPGGQPNFLGVLLAIVLGFVMIVVAIVLWIVMIVVLVVLCVPGYITYLSVTTPGPARYVLDVVFVWYLGMLLYGVVFPLLWRVIEPIVANTLGEVAFQRARHRVYGDRPRYSHPFYLGIAVVGLMIGGTRLLAPVATSAAAGAGRAWQENISASLYTPTPKTWPKKFAVAAGAIVRTGIVLPAQEEIAISTTADVVAEVSGSAFIWLSKTSDDRQAGVRPQPFAQRKVSTSAAHSIGAPREGELVLWGQREAATVTVHGAPVRTNRRWLTAGEDLKPEAEWFDKDDVIERCVGVGLSYRMRSRAKTSAWVALPAAACGIDTDYGEKADRAPMAGYIEFRAGKFATWFEEVRPKRAEHEQSVWHWGDPTTTTVLDTKIPVKPGDRFRVRSTTGEKVFVLAGKHIYQIPPYKSVEIPADWAGNIRIRREEEQFGFHAIEILHRGSGWK